MDKEEKKHYKGKVFLNGDNIKDCVLKIEYGKLQRVDIKNESVGVNMKYIPNENGEFKLERLSEKGGLPASSNYRISYKNSSNENIDIYLNLSKREVFNIKWELKKYLIQKQGFKNGLLIALVIGIFTKGYDYIQPKTHNENIETKTINKKSSSSESSDLELDSVKIDTIMKSNKSTILNKN